MAPKKMTSGTSPLMIVMILLMVSTSVTTTSAFQSSSSSLMVGTSRTVPSVFRISHAPTSKTVVVRHQQQHYSSHPPASNIVALFTALEASVPPPESASMIKLRKYAGTFCNLFPVWTLITAVTALYRPQTFLSIPSSTFPAQIGMLMLCMGITLRPSDFKRVAQRPGAVALAFVGCYGVMPGLAWTIGKALALSPSLAAGLVLVACINGAQASNLCTYIGQGDLALSVLMTTLTTIGAVIMTPTMGKLLLGQVVPVNAGAIAMSTVQVVLAPILVGMSFNAKFPNVVKQILPFSPVLGVLLTCALVGTSVAGCAGPILTAGFKLQAAAALLHGLGGVAGYFLTKPFYSEDVCRTFAIEFAMKSSAFGYLLATLHFPDFAVRVPAAVSIVWMTLIGSSLAVASRFFPPAECVVPYDEDE